MGKNDMAGRRRKSAQPNLAPTTPDGDESSDAAFNVWLNRGLHQLYDDVAREPIPDELLNIIEADRDRASSGRDANNTDAASPAAPAPRRRNG